MRFRVVEDHHTISLGRDTRIHKACPRGGDDTLAWGPGLHGKFTVKSAYEFASDLARSAVPSSSSNSDGSRPIWKLLWSIKAPPSVLHFAWRLATNSLPT